MRIRYASISRYVIPTIALWLLASCGGGSSSSYLVSAAVTGLQAGKSLVLLNNGANSTLVSANGLVAFSNPISSGSSYSVTVGSQPVGETCAPSPGSHASGVSSVAVTVDITCTPNLYTIGGMVGGLVDISGGVVLQNNYGDTITVGANGTFTFPSPLASGVTYVVTVLTSPNGENCTVANGSGTVQGANVSNVSVSCVPLPFRLTVSVFGTSNTMGLVLQNNGGDDLSAPASGVYVFKTVVSSGSQYHVTILTQPDGNTCFVIGGSGTITADTAVTVVCPWHVAYMSGAPNSNAVYGYYIDESLGTLIPFGIGPFGSGDSPGFIAISPDSRFAYVITGDNTVWVYAIDAITGGLSHIATNPVAAGAQKITLSPDGYVAYIPVPVDRAVFGFAINRSTGEFAPVPGSPFATVGYPQSVTLNPTGTVAYVQNSDEQAEAFDVDSNTGALAPIIGSPFAGVGDSGLFIDPTGLFLYGYNNSAISGFHIDPGTGVLSPISGSPFAGSGAASACFEPTGRFVYTINVTGFTLDTFLETVSTYGIDTSTGAISFLTGYDVQLRQPPALRPCTVDPSGKYFFLVGDMGYAINSSTGENSQLYPSWPDSAAGMTFMAIASLH